MNWINTNIKIFVRNIKVNWLFLTALLISLIFIYLAWYFKVFVFLILSLFFFLVSLSVNFTSTQKIILPIISSTLIIAIVEMLIPFFLSPLNQNAKYDKTSGYVKNYNERIPGFGYKPRPGKYTSRKLTANNDVIYDVVYTIGSDGFRKDTSSDTYDTYIYGGSFTFGEGLNDNETISAILQNEYNLSVKNMGIHGYGMHQALYNIKKGFTIERNNGVVILLTAPWHALRSSCKPSYSAGTPKYSFHQGNLINVGVCPGGNTLSLALEKSNIIKLIKLIFYNNTNKITNKDIDLYLGIIKEIYFEVRKLNGKLLIAYIDAEKKHLISSKSTNQSLQQELQKISNLVVNVTLNKNVENMDPIYYIHELDKHPSYKANKERAKLLNDTLKLIK